MDANMMLMGSLGIVALAAGLVIGWLAARSRTHAVVQAAVAEAQASGQVELATLTERLSASIAALESERRELSELRKTSDARREERHQAGGDASGAGRETVEVAARRPRSGCDSDHGNRRAGTCRCGLWACAAPICRHRHRRLR